MGTDIYSYVEVRREDKWHLLNDAVFPPSSEYGSAANVASPFDWRSYGTFGFLADVRNMSRVPCIQEPVYSLPEDCSEELRRRYEDYDNWPCSHITLKTLLEFDYDQTFEDRRIDGGNTCEPGSGEVVTFREFLGETFFRDLEIMKTLGAPENVRVIFHFD
jgi:hypothetical protein